MEGWVGFRNTPDGLMFSDVIMGFVDDTTGVVTFDAIITTYLNV